MLTTSAAANPRAARQTRIAGLDAFEHIREQAHAAFDAIRSGCRDDRNCIASRLSAQALAKVANEISWSDDCADELLDNEQWAGNNARSFAVAVDVEQPADGGFTAVVGGGLVAAVDESPTNELNESAEAQELPAAPGNLIGKRRPIESDADDCTDYPNRPLEKVQPFTGRRHPDFQDVLKTLCGDRASSVTSRMPLPTEEQQWNTAELLARQNREHDDLLKHPVETRSKEELVRAARKAAQRAVRESGLERQTTLEAQGYSWRNMWIALAIISAILLFLRLRFY